MCHVRKAREVHTDLWWGGLMERGHLKDIDVDGSKLKKNKVF
jgi:hypothetical protein